MKIIRFTTAGSAAASFGAVSRVCGHHRQANSITLSGSISAVAVARSEGVYSSVRHFSVGAFPVPRGRKDTDRKMRDRNIKSTKSRRAELPSLRRFR